MPLILELGINRQSNFSGQLLSRANILDRLLIEYYSVSSAVLESKNQYFSVLFLNEVVLVNQVSDDVLIANLACVTGTAEGIVTVIAHLAHPVGEEVVADEEGTVGVCPVVNLNSESLIEAVRFHCLINERA